MAAQNRIDNNTSGLTDRVVAYFSNRNNAYRALSQLREAGFNTDNIGLAVGDHGDIPASAESAKKHDSSFWQQVKDFFSGDNYEQQTNFRDATRPMGWTDERYRYYKRGISAGGAVVIVSGTRIDEAHRVLGSNGGDLRESGFDTSSFAARGTTADIESTGTTAEHRIQLRGELLRTYKEEVRTSGNN